MNPTDLENLTIATLAPLMNFASYCGVCRQDERGGADSLCAIPFNVTGLPSMSVPCGFAKNGTPIDMQIASGPLREELIFTLAHAYEQATDWHKSKPPLLKP
jgi:Asp-tRNA(Asn)/Glu-tRNA(Gln) amidotransferase A subunit family amidase